MPWVAVALRHRLREQGPITTQAYGDLVWQPEQEQVLRLGEPLHLTPMEYRLFHFMASSPGRVLTHGTLLREVWGHSSLEQAQSVRVTVAALRRKLQENESGIRYIGTEIGTGYRFLAPKPSDHG